VREEFESCSVFWMTASDMESLHQAYTHIARQLNVPGWDNNTADVRKLVQLHLSKESTGQWLLVFDNADVANLESVGSSTIASLIEYLPSSRQGAIVFTTTDMKTAVTLESENIVELPGFEQDMAQKMLETCLISPTNEQKIADLLLKELAYLPLAIMQAAAYVNINKITLQEYLLLLAKQKKEVTEPISTNSENVIATTWLISFEQIRRRDTLAADYLLFMACVDRNDIPLALLPTASPREKSNGAVRTLEAYSFVTIRTVESALDLHRLVHLSTHNWLQEQGFLSQQTEKVIARLFDMFPDDNHENRSKWRRLLPHAKFALSSGFSEQENENRRKLARKYALTLLVDGRPNEAEAHFQEYVQISNRVLGIEHPDTLRSMINLATTYRNQGRWKEAEELNVQVVETSKRVLGIEHPDTLRSINNLASTYWNQGRWKEAEELEVQVVETTKRVLGTEHPDTLSSMNSLATMYRNQGRLKEAEELMMRSS
jgi:tetratricopeptide (TPR) repeat protein